MVRFSYIERQVRKKTKRYFTEIENDIQKYELLLDQMVMKHEEFGICIIASSQ